LQTGPQGPVSFKLVNGGERFTVLGFYNQTTSGTWYDIPVYDSGSDTTTFYGEAWHLGLGTAMEEQGTTLVPDVETVQWTVEKAQLREAVVHLTILSITVNTGAANDEIVVRGRADDLASNGDRFFIQVPPQFVNDPDDGSGADAYTTPERGGSRYLYAGYRYEMRRPGGTLGSPQPNAGWYYCWNRMYDPLIGRFTSPDPAASPWSNLWDYVSMNPVQRTDPAGLQQADLSKNTCYTANLSCPDADKVDTYDRPLGGVRMKTKGCKPTIYHMITMPSDDSPYAEGVKDATNKRIAYLRSKSIEPQPAIPGDVATAENVGLGYWKLRYFDKAAEGKNGPLVGQAAAFVVIVTYCCGCTFDKYEHLRLDNGNWVRDATDDVERQHLTKEYKAVDSDGYSLCYRARAALLKTLKFDWEYSR